MPVVKGEDGLYHRVARVEKDFPIKGSDEAEAKRRLEEAVQVPIESKAPAAVCTGCPLSARPSCLPERIGNYDVVFVGEGPGINEISASPQEFFIGRAGQLLWAGAQEVGFDRTRCGVNNATLCFPGDAFPVLSMWHCRQRLLQELVACQPKLIVAVGAQALSSLLGQEHGISDVQGTLYDYKLGVRVPEYYDEIVDTFDIEWDTSEFPTNNVKLMPCFHSAFVLRNPNAFYDFMYALQKAARWFNGDPTVDVQPEAFERHTATKENALELLQRVTSYDHIYADLETTGFDAFKDAIICISIAGRREGYDIVELGVTFEWSLFEDNEEALGLLIKSLERRIVGYWNGIFDCQFLQQYGIDAKVGIDVMMKHYTLDERVLSQGLKSSAHRYHNAPEWEAPLRRHLQRKDDSYVTIPFDILAQYATLDACYTGTLDAYVSKQMESNNWDVYNQILMPATNMFLHVIARGLQVDTTRLAEVHEEYSQLLDTQLTRLRELIGDDGFNPSSIPDARYLCYELLQLKVPRKLQGSTARVAIEQYRDIHEEVGLLLDFRSTRKMIGTYLEALVNYELDENDIWHPNIRVNGTVTGRLASGKGKNERSRRAVNALGVPKEKGGIKKLVRAPKGKLLLEGDGGQMELRVLGAVSNDKNMIADFRSGIDFHGIIRDRLFGRGPDKKNYTHQEVLDAKTIAFGPPYGRSAESIAEQLKCSVREADSFLHTIWDRYPDAINFLEARVVELKETGEIRSYYGRVRHWGLITEDTLESASKEGRNFSVQSPATDTNLLIMVEIYEQFDHNFILPLLPTHDAILCEIDAERSEEACTTFKTFAERRAQELMDTEMPFVYDVGIGPSWGDC